MHYINVFFAYVLVLFYMLAMFGHIIFHFWYKPLDIDKDDV